MKAIEESPPIKNDAEKRKKEKKWNFKKRKEKIKKIQI